MGTTLKKNKDSKLSVNNSFYNNIVSVCVGEEGAGKRNDRISCFCQRFLWRFHVCMFYLFYTCSTVKVRRNQRQFTFIL